MKNVRGFGMPPVVPRIVRIIVTSAEGEGLFFGRHACVFSPHVPVVVHFVENMRHSPPKYQSLVMGRIKRQVFDPSGSPFERGESSKEDPLTFRLTLNEG